jgi:short-subunit dehydrogenase
MNIVITGASNGIGYYTALATSQKPGVRILAISRSEGKLLQLQQEATKINPLADLQTLPFDISDFKEEILIAELKKIRFDSVAYLLIMPAV